MNPVYRKDRQRHQQADVQQDHSGVAPDEPQVPHGDVQRDDRELERQDDPEYEKDVDKIGHPVVAASQDIRAQGTKCDQYGDARSCDDHAALHRPAEPCLTARAPRNGEVRPLWMFRERERRLRRLGRRVEREREQQIERRGEDSTHEQEGKLASQRPPPVPRREHVRSAARSSAGRQVA
jgi:hypothetical protein